MLLLAGSAGGCAVSFPIASMYPGKDEVTASIKPLAGQLADPEDRRRAKAALTTAIDPQGPGTAVSWSNPSTGDRGTYTPVGHAYPADGRICRAFLGTVHQGEDDRSIQGTACAATGGDWAVTDAKPVKKS